MPLTVHDAATMIRAGATFGVVAPLVGVSVPKTRRVRRTG